MSTRAMAKHYANLSGGGGSHQFQSDLWGDKERRANRMAEAELARQLQVMKLAEELDRETGGITSKRKMDEDAAAKRNETISKAGFTPEQWKVLEPLLTEKQMNELKSTLATQKIDKSDASGLDPRFLSTSGAGYLATQAAPAIAMQEKSQIRTQPGEDVSFRPWTDLSTMAFGSGARNESTSMEFMPSIDANGKVVQVPKSSEVRSQSSGKWDIPTDPTKRKTVGISTEPVTPAPMPLDPAPTPMELKMLPQTQPFNIDPNILRTYGQQQPLQAQPLSAAPSNAPSMTAFGKPAINNPQFFIEKLKALDRLMKMIPSNANPGY